MILIWSTQPPLSSLAARETLDTALAFATYEQPVSLLFTGQGVLQLADNQAAVQSGAKNMFSLLKALPIYDLDEVFVSESDLHQYQLTPAAKSPAIILSDDAIAKLITGARHVIRI